MWDVGLASMFKERDKKDKIGPCEGLVVSLNPLKINIFDGEVTLQKEQLYITYNLVLKQGDKVLIIPAESEQIFFIVNKIEKVGG